MVASPPVQPGFTLHIIPISGRQPRFCQSCVKLETGPEAGPQPHDQADFPCDLTRHMKTARVTRPPFADFSSIAVREMMKWIPEHARWTDRMQEVLHAHIEPVSNDSGLDFEE